MELNNANPQQRPAIVSLLQSQKLPTEDLPQVLDGFFTATADGHVVGIIGLEQYGSYGLLRSMVVDPEYRNKGIAERLVATLEHYAAANGVADIFLLTETAAGYFSKKGYANVERSSVPAEVKASSEFSHVCPASAAVMVKKMNIYVPITP